VSAAAEIFSNQSEKATRVAHAVKHALDNDLYGYVLPASRFLYSNALVTTFNGLSFALVRLFGGELRPFMCSIYLATAAHPRATTGDIPEDQMLAALEHHRAGYDSRAPVFFPVWDFGAPLPHPPDGSNQHFIRRTRRENESRDS
jgi:hypothetical protein